jgi:hypothetical protein
MNIDHESKCQMVLREEYCQKIYPNLIYWPTPEELEEAYSPGLDFEVIPAFSNTMLEYESC